MSKKHPKQLFPESKHIINYAFTCGDINYYKHDDVFNLPYERGMMALAIYEECRMGINREYLEAHTQRMTELLREPKIDIFKINLLNEQIKERLIFVADTDLLYKLASVVFFDKNENPNIYERDYCQKKIEHWKAHKDLLDFFLQKPLKELIPYLNTSENDLKASFQVAQKVRQVHSETLQQLNFNS